MEHQVHQELAELQVQAVLQEVLVLQVHQVQVEPQVHRELAEHLVQAVLREVLVLQEVLVHQGLQV